MGKVIKLTETQLRNVVKSIVKEMEGQKGDLQELIPLLADSESTLREVISIVNDYTDGSQSANNMTFSELYDTLEDATNSVKEDDPESYETYQRLLSQFGYFVGKQSSLWGDGPINPSGMKKMTKRGFEEM